MSTAANTQSVFNHYIEEYENACAQGLTVSGETRDYFARKRVEHTLSSCPETANIYELIDFGCGLGHSTPHFLECFPRAKIWGVDEAVHAIRAAQARYGGPRAAFVTDQPSFEHNGAGLAYCNGVFHHIQPAHRKQVAKRIFGWLAPGGFFALWENNPWNPGTRLVMHRIPFDRDAIPLCYLEAEGLLRSVGFRTIRTAFHFFFPAFLRPLRRLEPFLTRFPFGAQYCVLAQKPLRKAHG